MNIVPDGSGNDKEYCLDWWVAVAMSNIASAGGSDMAYIIPAGGSDNKEHCFG